MEGDTGDKFVVVSIAPNGIVHVWGDRESRPYNDKQSLDFWEETAGPEIEDTTRPATVEEYRAWLRGRIANGGHPTHIRDYPFASSRMRYATTDVVIDSRREFSAKSRNIILAPGVKAIRTNPHGPFNGWGHDCIYAMDGYQVMAGHTVPMFTDTKLNELRD